jgi:meso-butanediol dehydrogenase/(S,S)-butanediol dehydrogenase/diacetyl reductase
MVDRMRGKVAIVTGAAGTIGQAVALLFAREGCGLVLASSAPSERAARLEAALQPLGSPFTFLYGDARDEGTAQRTVDAALALGGRLDALINNAAVDYHSEIPETPAADFDRVMDVNVRGPVLMMKHAIPAMERQGGGAIVNVTSRLAMVGLRTQAVYCGTKGALVSMTRAMALDHAHANVRINCVCPGPINGPMMRDWFEEQDDPAGFERRVLATIPLGRLGEADEVAKSILFLASDDSSYITGATLLVDGGYTAA